MRTPGIQTDGWRRGMGGWGWGGVCGEGVVAARGGADAHLSPALRFDAQIERDTATPIRRVIHQTRPGGASSATLWRLRSEDCKLLSQPTGTPACPVCEQACGHGRLRLRLCCWCCCGARTPPPTTSPVRAPRPLTHWRRPPCTDVAPSASARVRTADVRIGMERVWTVWCVATGKASSTRLVFQIEPKEGPASGGTQVHTFTQSTLNA